MLLSLSTILLLTMLLQTLGATNVRVMLPLLVHELGGTDGFFGYIQAVRYFSISASLVVTPGLVEAVRRFRWSELRAADRAGTADRVQERSNLSSSSADLVPLGLLLPVIAVLNILVCSTALDLLPYIVGAVEAINSVVYVILSSLSQTVVNRVAFTTRLRLIQSLGSAALGPVTLLLISFAASFVQPKVEDGASAAPTVLFSMPFYLHAATTAGLFVLLLSAFWSSGPRLHPPASAVTRKYNGKHGNFVGDVSNDHKPAVPSVAGAEAQLVDSVPADATETAVTAVASSKPARDPAHSCFEQGASVIAEVVTDSRTGSSLVTFMMLQSISSSLGEVVSIGIASHLQHLSDAASNATQSFQGGTKAEAQVTDGASGVVLSDSIASAVAFCAVYAVGALLARLIGGPSSSRSLTAVNGGPAGTDMNVRNQQRQRAIVGACLSVLNFTTAAGMLLLAVGTSSAQASLAYAVFRTSVRCQQVPTTLLLGLHILDDDGPRGRTFRHCRLARLASAFSLFKFVSMVAKVAAASFFATLFADGYALAELSWWSGGALAAASAVSLLQSCYRATRLRQDP